MLPAWQMAVRRVAFEHVGVQVFAVAVAHGRDEVVEVVAAAGEVLDLLAVLVPGDAAIETDGAAFALDDDAHATRRGSWASLWSPWPCVRLWTS